MFLEHSQPRLACLTEARDVDFKTLFRVAKEFVRVFDHRVIDGTPAARFLDRIAQLIQELRLLLLIG